MSRTKRNRTRARKPALSPAPAFTKLEQSAGELAQLKRDMIAQDKKVEAAQHALDTAVNAKTQMTELHRELQRTVNFEALLVKPE